MRHLKFPSIWKAIVCINLFCLLAPIVDAQVTGKTNVIIVVTDDQGYGDLSCHGNPWLKTHNIDKLHDESIRLNNFHVSPTCSPTRAALLTGHFSNRTGAWHTVGGRSMVRDSDVMIADVFNQNGYETGMFGKWHLGDNHPFRPQDNGFTEVLMHGGGGVGQQPDYWENDYFNDTYFRNGEPEKVNGYCTDVWFDNAMAFMDESKAVDKPFFCYISTNAPHSPYYVATKYSKPYQGVEGVVNANYYGMVANLDENMGKLLSYLDKTKQAENTILIFMTDNGVSNHAGLVLDKKGFVTKGYNSGMRGAKVSEYEGGHRVPFFMRWPQGKIEGGKEINELTAHIDVMPTLIDMLDLNYSQEINFDGVSLKGLLNGKSKRLKKRTVITDSQRLEYPQKWRKSAAMRGPWRLINGKELYNLDKDPGQKQDIAQKYPEVVKQLRKDYENWWADIEKDFEEFPAITLCHSSEPSTILHTMDIHLDEGNMAVWRQEHERALMKSTGWFAVNAPLAGDYQFSLFRYAVESNLPINSVAPKGFAEIDTNVKPFKEGVRANFNKARLTIDGKVHEVLFNSKDKSVDLKINVTKGFHKLRVEFIDNNGVAYCANHTRVTRVN